MRQRFKHHLPLTSVERDSVWEQGLLTVDTNVLLDLYRYHEQTRDDLLSALELFRNRLWLSHQAAGEFFRNRNAVVAGVSQEFDNAEKLLASFESELKKVVDQLRRQRPLSKETVTGLSEGVLTEIAGARSKIQRARHVQQATLASDPTLEKVLSLFEGAVGPEPSDEDAAKLAKEAERRRAQKIPPGYLDAPKDGDRANGDYILWAQILEHARREAKPMILVTSEGKDDWWERHHGKTAGPRPELLDEAAKVCGQRVLIYRTDQFLTHVAERVGRKPTAATIKDIQYVSLFRAAPPPQPSGQVSSAADQIEAMLDGFAVGLVDSDDRVTSLIAGTNASSFYPDSIEVLDIGAIDFSEMSVPFRATIHFSGDQDLERMFCGDAITAEISGVAHYDGSEWEIVEYELTAELDDWGEEPDDDDR